MQHVAGALSKEQGLLLFQQQMVVPYAKGTALMLLPATQIVVLVSNSSSCNHLVITGEHFSVDCQWSTWSNWTDCSATCGGGTQLRSRLVEQVAQNGGLICSGSLVESKACNTQTCVPPQGKVIKENILFKSFHLSHHT